MHDVARRAGVSIATVSLALRNHPSVSSPTKQRVLRAQAELGYRVNRHARSLIQGVRLADVPRELETLVFLLVNARFDDATYAPFLEAVLRESKVHGHIAVYTDVLQWPETSPPSLSPLVRDGRVDGLIVSGSLDEACCRYLESFRIPMLVLGAYDLSPSFEQVECDVALLAREATARLIADGRQRVALVCRSLVSYYHRLVVAGYKEALRQAGVAFDARFLISMVPDSEANAIHDHVHGEQILDRLLSVEPKPDALVLAGQRYAEECITEMRVRRIRFPEDLALAAITTDPQPPVGRRYPAVLLDSHTMGRTAVQRLRERVKHPHASPIKTTLRDVRWV